MPTMLDAGDGGAAASDAEGTGGFHPTADEMSFHAPGWAGPIWRADRLTIQRVEEGELVWDRYDIHAAYLTHAAALLAAQGMAVGELFPAGGFFPGRRVAGAPFIFLAGQLELCAVPPSRVENVTLARVLSTPPGMQMGELLGRLVETVLRPR
jgi:hypothetical protein